MGAGISIVENDKAAVQYKNERRRTMTIFVYGENMCMHILVTVCCEYRT